MEILIVKLFHQYSFDDQSEVQLLNAFINQKPLPIEKVETLRSYITMVKIDTNIFSFQIFSHVRYSVHLVCLW